MKRKCACIFLLAILMGLQGAAQVAGSSAAQPHIASVTPKFLAPGTEVRIAGTGFGTKGDEDSLWVGGKEASIRSWSDTLIVAVVPVGAATKEAVVFKDEASDKYPVKFARTSAGPQPQGGNTQGNGILVNGIKIYDDQALQQALNAARAQLGAIQALNGSTINAQVGSLQGSTLSQSAFAVNLGTAPTPGVQTTANTGNTSTTAALGATSQLNSGNAVNTTTSGTNNQATLGSTANNSNVTTTGATPGTQVTSGSTSSFQNQSTTSGGNTLAVTGPSSQLSGTSSNQTQVTGPSTQTVTTQGPVTAAAPSIAPSSLSLPTSFSPGASGILNEQLELTYEITGYELLLEGALSDHYLRYLDDRNNIRQVVRPRATIGVPIMIAPSNKQYQDAVAEIEVAVTLAEPLGTDPEAPIVTAILPRDKTYNVAAITDKSVSIGGAIATQVISLGASALWGHKSYFVVQDQDTVALQIPPKPGDGKTVTRFGWQIRPVLGQKVVTTGMRNCFVQLAFGESPAVANYGSVHITARWRKYDRKRGIVLDDVVGPVVESNRDFAIPRFKLNPAVGAATYEDNGDGSVTVSAKGGNGEYLPGTFAKVGPLSFVPGINGTVQDPSGIRFALPANQLATHNAYLVDRSGDATQIVDVLVQRLDRHECLQLSSLQAGPAGAGMTKVTATVALTNSARCIQDGAASPKSFTKTMDLVAVVGNQVFGLRNAPFL